MRAEIIAEIKRLSEDNGGKPPGIGAFEKVTGIAKHLWLGKIWVKWADALEEAGYKPNSFKTKADLEPALEQFAIAVRKYNRVPSRPELEILRTQDSTFPSYKSVVDRFGSKSALFAAVKNWASQRQDYSYQMSSNLFQIRTQLPHRR